MASGGAKTWATSQPSAAFVLKCAKEQEKLRVKLQKQLQDHLLQLLEDGQFADVLVAVNDNKQHSIPCYQLADVSDQINKDPLSIVKAHRAILKVRVPALYNEFCKQEVSTNDGKALRSYIGKTHLLSLLRKVYTEDDIRKSECEAVRLGKILSELSSDRLKTGLNKQVDSEVKDDVDKASNGELFVTPTTSPLSPEKKENIARIFREHDSVSSINKVDKFEVNTDNSFQVDKICKTKDMNRSRETAVIAENNNNIKFEPNTSKKQTVRSFILPIQEQTNNEYGDVDSNKNSQTDDVPTDNNNSDSPSSGMVRSGTFDLQSQLPLEEALDTDPEQCDSQDGETTSLMKTSDDENMLSEEICSPKMQESTRPLFLHRTTQLLKSEFSQDSSSVERVRNLEHEAQNNSPSRRLDVSVMSDSGFMSQSTFSLVSEAGLQCSLSSSLVTSLESGLSPSAAQGKEADDPSSVSTSKNHKRSSSMFPFYIDIDSLTSDVANPKPSQQPLHHQTQSVYMYIDASNSKTNGKNAGDILGHDANNSYFHRKTSEPVNAKELYSKLTKVHSFPQLSSSSDGSFMTCHCNSPDAYIKKRPQSCYMFIDLDSLEAERNQEEEKHKKKLSKAPSISMFIDLKGNMNDSVEDAQQTYNEFQNKSSDDGKYLRQKSKDCDRIHPSPSEGKKSEEEIEKKSNVASSPLAVLKQPSDEKDTNKKPVSECIIGSTETSINIKQQICESLQASSISKFAYSTSSTASVANPLGSLRADVFEGEVICRDIKETSTNELQHTVNEKAHFESNSERQNTVPLKNELQCKNLKNQSNTEIYTKKESNTIEQGEGLLPMSPILRRKEPKKEQPKPPPQPVLVKGSTLPQDVDAMTFRRPDKELDDDVGLPKKNRETDDQSTGSKFSSPLRTPKLPGQSKPVTVTSNFESTKSSAVKQQQDGIESGGPIQQQPSNVVELSESFTSSNTSSVMSSDTKSISDMLKERQLLSPPSWCEIDDDSETIYSEVSDISSSFLGTLSCSSGQGKKSSREGQSPETDLGLSGAPTYRILQACSKLGEDLLKMFIEEIDADITIQVQEKEIRAHRCILVARCKYFAAVLKESWIESDGSTINLQGFSYPAVYFALCHIYSGAINFPQDVNIAEVALLADMLQLDTLKEVVVFHLKMNYCHFFHRPCSHCIQGVIECLHLAASCNLNELREKCIRWLGKYFARTWPNKCFAALPEEIREECYQNTLPNLNVDNLIETILCCDRLIATLSHVKWTEPVYEMVTRLLQDCIYFMALHFDETLTSDGFLALGKGQSWNVTSLEDSILSAVEILTPDNACRSYVKISEILSVAESENSQDIGQWTQNFIDLLHRIQRQCERFLIHNANHVVHCRNWALLAPEVQKRIKDAAIIVFEFEKPTAPPPRLSSLQRKMKKQKENEDQSLDEKFSTYPRKTKSLRGRKICRKGSEQSRPRSISHDEQLEREMNRNDRVGEDKKQNSAVCKGSPAKVCQKPRRSFSSEAVLRHAVIVSSPKNTGKLVCSSSEQNILNQKEATHKVPNFPKVISEGFLKLKTLEDDEDIKLESREENKHSKDVPYVSTHEKQTHTIHVAESKQKNLYTQNTRMAKFDNPNPSAISTEEKSKTQLMTGKHHDKDEPSRYPNKTESSTSHKSQNTQFTTKSSQVAKVPPFTVKTDCKSPSTHYETFVSRTSPCNSTAVDLSPIVSTPDGSFRDQDADGQNDLVAEIDADSSLVSHCLQEAEILEQELSRKLQRQQQASSVSPVSPTPAPVCSVPKVSGSSRLRIAGAHKSSLQKPSGVPSRERSHSGGSLRSCSAHSSHVASKGIPKIETQTRDQKGSANRPSLPRPINSNQRQYRSMESVVTQHSRQTSSHMTQARVISSRTRQRPSSTSRKYDLRYSGTDGHK